MLLDVRTAPSKRGAYLYNEENMTFAADIPIRLYGAVPDSIVDGPGLRYAIFVQGCSHGCPGCHNPESQPSDGGTLTTVAAVLDDVHANGLVHNVTFSGGEPFEQAEACAALARQLKAEGYGIWAYTGYLYEDLARRAGLAEGAAEAAKASDVEGGGVAGEAKASEPDQAIRDFLACIDVLVDGPFVEKLKSLGLKWCGSSNQRLIDVPASRKAGHAVIWEPPSFVPPKPASW